MKGRLSTDYYTADMISDILGSGKSSRLRERLVKQLKQFVSVDVYITGSIDNGLFVIEGKLKEGVSAEEAKKSIWNEIAVLQQEQIEAKELEKVKNKTITFMSFSENDLMSRAIGLCYYEMLGDPNQINLEEEKYLSVSTKDIQEFAINHLNEHQSTTLFYLSKTLNN